MIRALDLFCGGGGAGMGYHMAGMEVTGVDIEPWMKKYYPFKFVAQDALSLDPAVIRRHFDFVHASPPCKATTSLSRTVKRRRDEDPINLIPKTRALLLKTGLPFVIENVEDAAPWLVDPILLCGSAFGMRVRRHRLFEIRWVDGDVIEGLRVGCDHRWQERSKVYVIRSGGDQRGWRWAGHVPVYGHNQMLDPGCPELPDGTHIMDRFTDLKASVAMGIDWLDRERLNQAIPPVYTRHIGLGIAEVLEAERG